MAQVAKISEYSSGRPISEPISREMFDSIAKAIDKEYIQMEQDQLSYMALCNEASGDDSAKIAEAVRDMEAYDKEVAALEKTLSAMERESHGLKQEMQKLEGQSQKQDGLETEYWEALGSCRIKEHCFIEQRDSIQTQIQAEQQRLDTLSQSKLPHELFCIECDGLFGTINGFRLGRLPNTEVEWEEINVAWGQAALLLHTIAQRAGSAFKFSRHKVITPMGSTSKMRLLKADETREDPSCLEMYDLHGSNSKNFDASRFNFAMVGWLDCLVSKV